MKLANKHYKQQQFEIKKQLRRLQKLLQKHQDKQVKDKGNWCYAGDLEKINELMNEAVGFLSN